MSGFFAINKTVLDSIKFTPLTWKTCLEVELKAKPNVTEIPINFKKREAGVSKTTAIVGLKLLYGMIQFQVKYNDS